MRFNNLILFLFACIIMFSCSEPRPELITAEQIMETAPDSSLKILKKINPENYNNRNKALYALLMTQALDKNYVDVESDSLISIATQYFDEKDPVHAGAAWFYASRCAKNRGNGDEQAIDLLKAQELAEGTNAHKLLALIYSDKADMYEIQRQTDSVILLNKKAFLAFKLAKDWYNASLSAYTIGKNYLGNYDSLYYYFKEAEKIAKPLNNSLLTSTIYKGMGNAAFHNKDYTLALNYYKSTPLTNIKFYDINKYYLIGNLFLVLNQFDSAKYYMEKVNPHDYSFYEYYETWAKIYEHNGEYAKSLEYTRKVISVKDSLNNSTLKKSFAGLEKKYKFEHLAVENKNLIIENKQRGNLILISLLALSIIFIITLFRSFQINKKHLQTEQLINFQKKELLEKVIENNELLQRQSKMQLILLQNVEQYRNQSIKPKNIKNGESTPPSINKVQEEIIIHVDGVYNNISKRLSEKFPQLTSRDILICCMLLADFNTGMIATLLDVRNDSINIHRSRLRKKLLLDKNENLLEFLRNF